MGRLAPVEAGRIWAGRGASGLVALFLLVDGTMKLIGPSPVVEGSARLGYAAHLLVFAR
jgi:hypothetical protein